MSPKKVVNWEAMRKDYIIGVFDGEIRRHPSHEELSRKYNVSTTSISLKAGKEKWIEQRKEYEKQRTVAITMEFDNYLVKEKGTFDGIMQSILNNQMKELMLIEEARIRGKDGIKMSERLTFSQVLLNFQKIKESLSKNDNLDRGQCKPESIVAAYRTLYPEGAVTVIEKVDREDNETIIDGDNCDIDRE